MTEMSVNRTCNYKKWLYVGVVRCHQLGFRWDEVGVGGGGGGAVTNYSIKIHVIRKSRVREGTVVLPPHLNCLCL